MTLSPRPLAPSFASLQPEAHGGALAHPKTKPDVSVLIIDDDQDIRDLLVEILRDEGYSIATASNGVEALEVLETVLPRLILLDLNMPVMSGTEFNDARRKDPALRAIPTIVMTAADRIKNRVEGFDIVDAVPKPIHLDHLLRLVSKFCGEDTRVP